jgi:hypothetical protein
MNSSFIIEDIRKRSHRVHQEELLRRQREEDEEYETALPRRIINEAEENVSRKYALQGWKRISVVGALFLGSVYVIYRIMILLSPKSPIPKPVTFRPTQDPKPEPPKAEPKEEREEVEVRREPKRMVMFSVDRKLDLLQELYPRRWSKFERNFEAEWLQGSVRSESSLTIDFFLEGGSDDEDSVAIDMITSDMLQYPSPDKTYFNSQEEFENFIFTIKEKKDLCTGRGIVYKVLQMDKM